MVLMDYQELPDLQALELLVRLAQVSPDQQEIMVLMDYRGLPDLRVLELLVRLVLV